MGKVFISYSHDSEEHAKRVLSLHCLAYAAELPPEYPYEKAC